MSRTAEAVNRRSVEDEGCFHNRAEGAVANTTGLNPGMHSIAFTSPFERTSVLQVFTHAPGFSPGMAPSAFATNSGLRLSLAGRAVISN